MKLAYNENNAKRYDNIKFDYSIEHSRDTIKVFTEPMQNQKFGVLAISNIKWLLIKTEFLGNDNKRWNAQLKNWNN